MKKISDENMSTIQGGDMCMFNRLMIVSATAALYVAPFTGGVTLGITLGAIALATIVGAAYSAGAACR